jgi:hypothetical protein
LGTAPAEAVTEIKAKAKFEIDRILGFEDLTKWVVDAGLVPVNGNHGDAARMVSRVYGHLVDRPTLPDLDLGK